METMLFVGPGGSGKTEKLWRCYRDLALENQTDSILVLLWNARDVRDWRERVDLPWTGPLHVYTYFGWVQREIRRHWLRLRSELGGQWLEPEFLTVETGQYAMLQEIKARQADFAGLVTSPERLAIQLGSCLVLAALNGIQRHEIGQRLASAMPDKEPRVFAAAQTVLDAYCARLEQAGVLDYGLAVELYRQLQPQAEYQASLKGFRHLLMDDVDEQSPAAHDFVEMMLEQVDSAALSFSTDGGHAGFFGADPQGGWRRFAGRACIHTVRRPGQNLAASGTLFSSVLARVSRQFLGGGPRVELLHEDLRSDVLDRVGQRVVQLVESGIPAADIAVIAPMADKVLEHTLFLHLNRAGLPLNVLTKNRRLIDEPYVRAMMTLALLAHPHWEMDWGVPDLAQSLQLLLKIDPVRAWLLSRQVQGNQLRDLEIWQRERVGFRAAQGYDLLRQWLDSYRGEREQPVDFFFQRVFGELLSRLPPARDDLVVCRQLIVSARKFLQSAQRFSSEDNPNTAFIRLLSAGTVAAESLLEPATRDQAVVLATPYAYISGHHHSRFQIWMDCTSRRWFQQDVREIINPHVLKRVWSGGLWGDEENESISRHNGARIARALLRRCSEGLLLTAANIDSRGFEQDGGLLEAVFAAMGEEGMNNAISPGSGSSS